VNAVIDVSSPFVETVAELLGRGQSVRFRAAGWSMHPTIRDGETITVAPFSRSTARTGEILLYRNHRTVIAHRVVAVRSHSGEPLKLVLRGDAADCCDAPIADERVLGRVVAVEREGRTLRFGTVSRRWSRILAWALRRVRLARLKAADIVFARTNLS
jgi:hypothetical protein